MKAYWEYRCDFGHARTIFRDEDRPETEADTRCPFGHEAVTLHKDIPVDCVQITLRPAARVTDRVTGKIHVRDRYGIILSNRGGTEKRTSANMYLLREAIHLIERFHGQTMAQAAKIWETLNP